MKHEIDLKNYQIRTDLIVEQVTDENNVSTKVYDENGIKITTVEVDKNMSEQINKKVGDYVTIEFDDVTDSHNQEIVKKIFSEQLSEIIKKTKI